MKPCDESIQKVIELADKMLSLSDEGDAVREDTNCGVLYGVIRDAAYRIKRMAETAAGSTVKSKTEALLVGIIGTWRSACCHPPTINGEKANKFLLCLWFRSLIIGWQHIFNPGTEDREVFTAILLPVK